MTERTILETPRLTLRRFMPGDEDWFATLFADPEVTQYLGGTRTRAQADEMFATRVLAYYDTHPGLGIWMTLERATSRSVGFHLLNHIQGEAIVQVGFGLEKFAWGKGYGTEMAREVLRYGFEDLNLPHIAAIANLENIASQHVLEKIGLVRRGERTFNHPAYASQGPLAWFELDAAAWRARQHE
jgi:ribosomal-protein-alanine N-acetyltransferase